MVVGVEWSMVNVLGLRRERERSRTGEEREKSSGRGERERMMHDEGGPMGEREKRGPVIGQIHFLFFFLKKKDKIPNMPFKK